MFIVTLVLALGRRGRRRGSPADEEDVAVDTACVHRSPRRTGTHRRHSSRRRTTSDSTRRRSRASAQVEDQPASAASPPSNPNLLKAGTKAPAFTLKTPTGETVSLSDYRGKATLLEFFATWCPHCNAESPHIRTLSKSMPAGEVRLRLGQRRRGDGSERLRLPPLLRLRLPGAARPELAPRQFHLARVGRDRCRTPTEWRRSRPST